MKEAAEALKGAQAELKPMGLSLKVYDCYRPMQAVAAFVDWSKEPGQSRRQTDPLPQPIQVQPFPDYIRHTVRTFARRNARRDNRAGRLIALAH